MPDSTRQSDDVPEDSVTERKLTRASGEKTVGGFRIRTVQGELDPGALQHTSLPRLLTPQKLRAARAPIPS